MELTEHRFEELSELKYRIFTCKLGGKHNATALVLSFSGVYGVGSEGNGDAAFMQLISQAAASIWRVDAVVFDFQKLSYTFGNSIWSLFGHGTHPPIGDDAPTALVVSDLCRIGFSTGPVPACFDDLESAIAFVSGPAIAKLDQRLKELGFDD